MAKIRNNKGFSLTEILMAVGILGIGMLFIASVFPAAIQFETIATERTMASVVAEEAFAKIRLYGVDDPCQPGPAGQVNISALSPSSLSDFNSVSMSSVFPLTAGMNPDEFAYPSIKAPTSTKHYYWSALCRRESFGSDQLVNTTVLVSRKTSPHLRYYAPNPAGTGEINWVTGPDTCSWPRVVKVAVRAAGADELEIINVQEKNFLNDGCIVFNGLYSYRVLERYPDARDNIIKLDRSWKGSMRNDTHVWLVPPPVGGGRYPCIAVYKKVLKFEP